MTRATYEEMKQRIRELQDTGRLPRTLTRSEIADWAYGNAAIENDRITREDADAGAALACRPREE
jgi:hypothetical protein